MKTFIYLCQARAITAGGPWWPMAPAGAWPWGQLEVATTTMARNAPSCVHHPREMSPSGDAWTGQGGWKRPTHVALLSTATQVASRTFSAPGWIIKASYGQHMHTLGGGPALQQRKSIQNISLAALPPHSIPALLSSHAQHCPGGTR